MSPFGIVCRACGAGMPTGVRYCGKCGASMDEKAAGPSEKKASPRAAAPVGVRLLLVAWGLGLLGGFMLGRGVAPTGSGGPGAPSPGAVNEGESAVSLLSRAHAASDAGRFSEARDLYRRVIALDPTYLPAHVDLGIALAALGEDEAAREAFRAALIGDAPHPAAAWNLALLEEEAGRPDRARELYARYLELEPEGSRAAQARAKIGGTGRPADAGPGAAAGSGD